MSKSVWFVVPAFGRHDVARVCLRQLRRTCDSLPGGVSGHAVVVADEPEYEALAAELGFVYVHRGNYPLGRKWNDGYARACDPELNPEPADWVVPLGSDDWVDPDWVAGDLRENAIQCTRRSTIVREDGTRLARLRIPYFGGDGVRVFPRWMLEALGYRPAGEEKGRAIDTSTFGRLEQILGQHPPVRYRDLHPHVVVDWKTARGQLNSYASCQVYRDGDEDRNPFGTLGRYYPAEALEEMRRVYGAQVAR